MGSYRCVNQSKLGAPFDVSFEIFGTPTVPDNETIHSEEGVGWVEGLLNI